VSGAPRLTAPLLRAMLAAVSAMLAGEEGEGDWPPEVTEEQLERAHAWIHSQLDKRTARRTPHRDA
jgi:hypothetical protein